MNLEVKKFFAQSEYLDQMVLRPLSHIDQDWELIRGNDGYLAEEGNLSAHLINLIDVLASTEPPKKYHDNEDRLAEYLVSMGSKIQKKGRYWIGDDYGFVLQQASLAHQLNHEELIFSAAGRVMAAIKHKQRMFDEMEEGHQAMLAAILTILVFNYGTWIHGTHS